MALAVLSIDIEARLAKLEEGMSKAVRINERAASQIEGRWAKLEKLGAGIGTAIGAAFGTLGVAALSSFVARTINSVDALNDLKDATGASIENLSAIEDIAARTGTSFDTVGAALIKLNNALKEADGKNTTSQALKAIGLEAEQLKSLDPAEALRRIAIALGSFADDGNKARIAQELFGKSLREVAPLLKDLAEAGGLNATVTTQQAAETEKFVNQLNALRKNITDMVRALLGEAIPAVNKFIEQWQKLGGLSGVFDSNFTQAQTKRAEADLVNLTEKIEIYRKKIEEGGGADSPLNAGAVKILAQLQARWDEVNAKVQTYNDKLKNIGDKAIGIPPSVADLEAVAQGRPSVPEVRSTPSATRVQRPPRAEVQGPPIPPDLVDALKRLDGTDIAKLTKLNEELAALQRIQASDPGRSGITQAISTVREEIDKLDPSVKSMADALREIEALFGQTAMGQAAALEQQLAFAAQAFDAGAISAEKYGAVIDDLNRKLANIGKSDEAVKGIEQLDERFKQFGGNVQDILAQGFEDGFANAGRGFEVLIKRMLAQAAAAKIGDVLFGDMFKTGKTGGILGAILGGISGGGLNVDTAGAGLNTGSLVPRGTTFNKGITYAPTINVTGGSNSSEVFAAATKAARESNKQFIDAVQRGLITLPNPA
jgi:hypothetical protein